MRAQQRMRSQTFAVTTADRFWYIASRDQDFAVCNVITYAFVFDLTD
jgi:hypothetical protein